MIVERGTIIKSIGDNAVVRISNGDSCGSCGAGCACSGDTAKQLNVVAKNTVGAVKGDVVQLSLSTSALFSISTAIYILPLVFLFAGALAGGPAAAALGWNLDKNLAAAVFGFGFLIVSFLVVTLTMRAQKTNSRNSPAVEKIIYRPQRDGKSSGFHIDLNDLDLKLPEDL